MKIQRKQRTVIFTLATAIVSLLTAILFLSHSRYANTEK